MKRVAIIHSPGTSCRCHEAIERAGMRFGWSCLRLDADHLPDAAPSVDIVLEHAAVYLGIAEWRWRPRAWAEERGLNVSGSSSAVLRLCDNKALAKSVMAAAGVRVPRGIVTAVPLDRIAFPYPVVVKAQADNQSAGLSLVRDAHQLGSAISTVLSLTRGPALIEEFIDGPEYQLPLLPSFKPLPIVELRGLRGVYDSRQKSAGKVTLAGASLPAPLDSSIRAAAAKAWTALGLKDYARFDLRLAPDGTPVFLEANAKPSFEEGCALDVSMAALGLGVVEAIATLVH